MKPSRMVELRDGSKMEIHTFVCPLAPETRVAVTELLRTEWAEGDLRWSESLAGDYTDSLTVVVFPAMREGRWSGTATVAFPARDPEVGVVCDVVTHVACRGLGIARSVTQAATDYFLERDGRAVYLGTLPSGSAWRVYQRIGFQWFHGGVMRYLPRGSRTFDEEYFVPGQKTLIRVAKWGDLPGVSALFTRPYGMLAGDYGRGLFSAQYVFQPRCVSIFPTIYYDVRDKGGICQVLIGESAHRVLGLASLTPVDTRYRRHVGILESLLHDSYAKYALELLSSTLQAGKEAGITRSITYVPLMDVEKGQWMRELGGRAVGIMRGQVQLPERLVDVEVFELGPG